MSAKEHEAEKKFEEAISDYLKALGDREGLIVDWLLITAEHIDDGNDHTATANGLYGPHHQRMHNALGLSRYAQIKIEKRLRS